jgi:glutathione S-transferase
LLPSALTDSHDILNWLSEQRPVLIPEKHRETIDRLMGKFYAFHMQALMLRPEDQKYGIPNQAAAQLERSDISEEHRRALEKKSIL